MRPASLSACVVLLFLSGCGSKAPVKSAAQPAVAPPPAVPGTSVEALQTEIKWLRERVAQLEQAQQPANRPLPSDIPDDTLISFLHSGDNELQRAAVILVRKRSSPRCRQALIALASAPDRDWNQRYVGLDALAEVRTPEVIEMWLKLLRDPNENVVHRAGFALGGMRNPEHVPHLLDAWAQIKSRDTATHNSSSRTGILNALTVIGDPRGLPAALEALQSPHPNTRAFAISALRAFRDESTVPAVLQHLVALEGSSVSDDVNSRNNIVEMLAEMGDKRGAPHFIRLLRTSDNYLRDRITLLLPRVCGPEHIPALQEALRVECAGGSLTEANTQKRVLALVRALGATAKPAAGRVLIELLQACPSGPPAQEAVALLPQLCTMELTNELVAAHKFASDAAVRGMLEKILRSGPYPVEYDEAKRAFKMGLPAVEGDPIHEK